MDVRYIAVNTPVLQVLFGTRPYKTVNNKSCSYNRVYRIIPELGPDEKSNDMTNLYVI